MMCQICGEYPAVGNFVFPNSWREIRPSLKGQSHAHMCDRCGMDAEFRCVPAALAREASLQGPKPVVKVQVKKPSYLNRVKKTPFEDELLYKVEWLSDKVITFVDRFGTGTDVIGDSRSIEDIAKYINNTGKCERKGMTVSVALAQKLVYSTRTKWESKKIFDLSPFKTVCPACFEIFTAEQADEYGRCEHCSFGKLHPKATLVVSNKGGHKMADNDEVKTDMDPATRKILMQSVVSSATNLVKRMSSVETPREKGEALVNVKILLDALEVLTKGWRAELGKLPGFYEMYPEFNKKAVLQEGRALTEIDNKVLDVLTLAEIKKIVKVTEKGLEEIDHKDLIPAYKITTGKGAATVQIRDLSQDDLKKLNG